MEGLHTLIILRNNIFLSSVLSKCPLPFHSGCRRLYVYLFPSSFITLQNGLWDNPSIETKTWFLWWTVWWTWSIHHCNDNTKYKFIQYYLFFGACSAVKHRCRCVNFRFVCGLSQCAVPLCPPWMSLAIPWRELWNKSIIVKNIHTYCKKFGIWLSSVNPNNSW